MALTTSEALIATGDKREREGGGGGGWQLDIVRYMYMLIILWFTKRAMQLLEHFVDVVIHRADDFTIHSREWFMNVHVRLLVLQKEGLGNEHINILRHFRE